MLPLIPLLLKAKAVYDLVEPLVRKPKEKVKRMKGWRTIAVNVAAILGVAGAHWGFDVPVETWEAVVLGVANVGLRFITTTPVGAK